MEKCATRDFKSLVFKVAIGLFHIKKEYLMANR